MSTTTSSPCCRTMEITLSRRRVVHVSPYYPPHLGGVERVARSLARGLHGRHDVEVWTTGPDPSTKNGGVLPEVGDDDHDDGDEFPVIRLPAVELANTPVPRQLFRRLLTLPSSTIVHVHVAHALWPELVAAAAARRHFTVVSHFHLDVDPTGAAGFLLPAYKRHLLSRALRRADAVLALTPPQRDFLAGSYGIPDDRLHVLRNGVDDQFFAVQPIPRRADEPLRILFVGRLDAQKNIPRLLRALAASDAAFEAVIVGDGARRGDLERLAKALGAGDVRFMGAQHGDSLLAHYAWADVFVLSSDREGMSLALLEAMAAGLALLVTDVPGLAEQVRHVGLVARPEVRDLSKHISHLARNRTTLATLKDQSRARAGAFRWPAVIDQLESIYEGIGA